MALKPMKSTGKKGGAGPSLGKTDTAGHTPKTKSTGSKKNNGPATTGYIIITTPNPLFFKKTGLGQGIQVVGCRYAFHANIPNDKINVK